MIWIPETGQRLPDDHPAMRKIHAWWAGTTLEERQAWHRFTCKNSRAPEDLKVVASLQKALEAE